MPDSQVEPQPQRGESSTLALPSSSSAVIRLATFWPFVTAVLSGLGLGLTVGQIGGDMVMGAAIASGAFIVAAIAARWALMLQRKVEALQQTLQNEASYRAFVESALEGFFRTTRSGSYLIANLALTRIYGYDSSEQLMSELTDISTSLYVDPNRRNEFHTLMARDGTVKDFVSQIKRRDGRLIWISENARTVTDDDGQFLFYEGMVQDITVQRESERATLAALEETREAARAKAAFLAAMSHELKTPLNAVIGFSDVMKQEIFGPIGSERYQSYIEDIHANGQRLLAMINDILDLSRIESRMIEIDDTALYVPDAIASARDVASQHNGHAAPVVIDLPRTLPMLKADPKRLHQILTHLLSNAMKFTPNDGEISVSAHCAPHGGIAITIKDSGIGMEPDRIEVALEPFKQLDNRLARRFEGVGLGLPLANALLRLHDAQLSIDSTPGKGTVVTIAFPPDRTVAESRAAIA